MSCTFFEGNRLALKPFISFHVLWKVRSIMSIKLGEISNFDIFYTEKHLRNWISVLKEKYILTGKLVRPVFQVTPNCILIYGKKYQNFEIFHHPVIFKVKIRITLRQIYLFTLIIICHFPAQNISKSLLITCNPFKDENGNRPPWAYVSRVPLVFLSFLNRPMPLCAMRLYLTSDDGHHGKIH